MNFNKQQLELLQQFVQLCKKEPKVLYTPELSFFRHWLESLGAKIPAQDIPKEQPEPKKMETEPTVLSSSSSEEEEEEVEEPESDVDIDKSDVIEDSEVPNQEMGDLDAEPTDEMLEQADNKRSEAMQAFSEGRYEEAIAAFTEVIKVNPSSAPMFAKRASCYLKLKRPNAAIKDCNRAIEINPDQAQAYKWRGLAYKLLGEWEKAFIDLSNSNRIDFAEDTFEAMKNVEGKAHRLQEHHRKYQRKREERELKQRQKRAQKARKAYERAKAKESSSSHSGHSHGHGHGMGGMGGGMPPGMASMFDPELMTLMQDPEVMAAMNEIMKDPSKMAMYASNPKVKKAMEMMQKNIFKGGFPGGMGGDMDDDVEMPDVSSKPSGHAHPSADDLD